MSYDHELLELQRVVHALLPNGQASFVADLKSPYKALVGGMGSGKTMAAVRGSLVLGSANPGLTGIFVEPTFSIVRDTALPAFFEELEAHACPYRWMPSRQTLQVGEGETGFQIVFRSGEQAHRLIGINAAWAMVDEPGKQDVEVFKRLVQRCRHPDARARQIGLTGTPEGLNWFFRVVEKEPPPGMSLYRARTADNPFLPKEYLERLRATLTEQELLAYTEGRFVNLTSGSVYQGFSPSEHVTPIGADAGSGKLMVGCDFNVDAMTWPIARRVGDELHVFDELHASNTNTYRMAAMLTERIQDLLVKSGERIVSRAHLAEHLQHVTVYTDATGRARKTAASESDIQILMAEGFDVRAANANPPVRDRVYSLERKMRERRLGKPTIFVDPKCTRTINALEHQVWADDGSPEKGKGADDLSGPTDALGYLIWGNFDWRATLPAGNRQDWTMYR